METDSSNSASSEKRLSNLLEYAMFESGLLDHLSEEGICEPLDATDMINRRDIFDQHEINSVFFQTNDDDCQNNEILSQPKSQRLKAEIVDESGNFNSPINDKTTALSLQQIIERMEEQRFKILTNKVNSFIDAVDLETTLIELRDYLSLLTNENLDFCKYPEQLEVYSSLLNILCICGRVNAFRCDPENALNSKDYEDLSKSRALSLDCTKLFISKLSQVEFHRSSVELLVPMVLLCTTHHRLFPWSNIECVTNAKFIITTCCKWTKCRNFSQLLLLEGKSSVISSVLHLLRPEFSKNEWKRNPSIPDIFQGLLLNIPFTHLIELLPDIFPPILLFIDDFELENQIIGIYCVNHLIRNVPNTILRQNGHAHVFYDALKRLMYIRESKLIIPLYFCLVSLVPVIEFNPNPISGSKCGLQDEIYRNILLHAETEANFQHKLHYIIIIEYYIHNLGIGIVKHLKRTLNLAYEYLSSVEDKKGKIRITTLRVLYLLINIAWPRMSFYCEEIMKTVLRLAYDLMTDTKNAKFSSNDGKKIMTNCIKCLNQLNVACPQKFQELTKDVLLDSNLDQRFGFVLSQVVNSKSN